MMEPSPLPPRDVAGPPSSPPDAAEPSSSAPEQGAKLFVGGISSDTREEALAEHFGRFGEVKEVAVMRDRVTGNGRGFGFVKFADLEAAETALKNPKHVIRGRTVEVKRAIPRDELHQNQQHQNPQQSRGSSRNCNGDINNASSIGCNANSKKIFIGGLPDSVTQHDLKSYFEKFGSVIDTVVMYDNTTQRPRGFGFITFSSEDSVATVLQNSFHKLNGKPVEVKIAVPKDDINCTNNRNNDNHDGPRATGGRGRRGPVYGLYHATFYPRYGDYSYFNYYAAAPFSPYFYGGLYGGGCNSSGLGGVVGSPRSPWNDSRGMVVPFLYPHVNGGFGSNMFVPTVGYAQDHGSDRNNENQGGPDAQTVTVGTMTESHSRTCTMTRNKF